jgi:hypothetical protein
MSKSQNAQELAQRKQDRFFFVIGLINEADVDGTMEFDTDDAEGRQFIAKFASNTYEGKTTIQLNFADMWHVDDPQVIDVPKDENALKLIPKNLRLTAAAKSETATAHSEPTSKPTTSPVNLDDI